MKTTAALLRHTAQLGSGLLSLALIARVAVRLFHASLVELGMFAIALVGLFALATILSKGPRS